MYTCEYFKLALFIPTSLAFMHKQQCLEVCMIMKSLNSFFLILRMHIEIQIK